MIDRVLAKKSYEDGFRDGIEKGKKAYDHLLGFLFIFSFLSWSLLMFVLGILI